MAEETQDQHPQDKQTADEQAAEAVEPGIQEAEEIAEQEGPAIDVDVEDVGTLKKKLSVTVPRERIDAKMDEMYGELSDTAQIPGFRIGRAPRRLIEKRFGREVAGDVKNALIGEALGQAIEQTDLKTLGEPDLDLEEIELPNTGDMAFSFEVEVQPEFELPELEGIPVERPSTEPDEERMEEFLEQMRESRASFSESEEPAEKGDVVTASAIISGEEIEASEHPGLTLRVAPGQIEGLPIVELGDALEGKKPDESVELAVTAPESHPNEDWRGKELTVKIRISSVRKRELPELDDAFAESSGFENLQEMREYLKAQLVRRSQMEAERAMREQICDWLLEQVDIDVPEGVAARHTARTVQRHYVRLLQQGVPRERIDENLTEIQAEATEQARRDLKLQFILNKIIEEKEIMLDEAEVNARIAQMAAQYNRRPERLRQELAADGTLDQVRQSLAEEKALNMLLDNAEVTEAEPETRTGEEAEKPDAEDADTDTSADDPEEGENA